MSIAYRTRQHLQRLRMSHPPFSAPMSGAGYDMEEHSQKEAMEYMRLQHAVKLAVAYYQRNPIPHEHAQDIRGFVEERAKQNYVRAQGNPEDHSIIHLCHAISGEVLSTCVTKQVVEKKLAPMFMHQPVIPTFTVRDDRIAIPDESEQMTEEEFERSLEEPEFIDEEEDSMQTMIPATWFTFASISDDPNAASGGGRRGGFAI